MFKELEDNKIVKYNCQLFEELNNEELGLQGIKTHHGMLDQVGAWLREQGYDPVVHDLRLPFPAPRYERMHGFRCRQQELLVSALRQERSGLIGAPTRYGKCLGPGTVVRMHDGGCLPVEAIEEGMQVAGPDGNPRTACGLVQGFDMLMRVIPEDGKSWVCTCDHLLVLWDLRDGGFERVVRADEFLNCRVPEHLRAVRLERGERRLLRFRLEVAARRGRYFGFELEGADRKFLLDDGTVTHNTTLMVNTLRAFPDQRTVVTAPGVDLCRQLLDDIRRAIPDRKVVGMYSGSGGTAKYPSDDITVCSMDSLEKTDPASVRLLLVDEPHACCSESRAPLFPQFTFARKYGFGATLTGRFDGKEPLIVGLLGPVLANRTYREAVAEGAVCPLKVIMLRVPYPFFRAWNVQQAYDRLVRRNDDQHERVRRICEEIIPKDWQTLVFISHEKQADELMELIPEGTVAMAKKMNMTERRTLLERMKSGEVRRCVASNIYSTGVTFSNVRAVVNAIGGGANLSSIQKPGRVLETRPGKRMGIMFDFFYELHLKTGERGDGRSGPCALPWIDSMNRLNLYRKIGYQVALCDDLKSVEREFAAAL